MVPPRVQCSQTLRCLHTERFQCAQAFKVGVISCTSCTIFASVAALEPPPPTPTKHGFAHKNAVGASSSNLLASTSIRWVTRCGSNARHPTLDDITATFGARCRRSGVSRHVLTASMTRAVNLRLYALNIGSKSVRWSGISLQLFIFDNSLALLRDLI